MRALSHRGLRGTFWPSELQEQLLVVALADPERAAAAWRAIRPRFVLDELEPGAFELMPLVYVRLAETVPEEPLLARLKGIYRREWVRSSVLVDRTKEVASVLGAAGIVGLFVEGAALAERFYPAAGLRTSWFVDVVVEPADAAAALSALADCGWSAPPSEGASRERWALTARDGTVCVVRTTPAYDFVDRRHGGNQAGPLWADAATHDLAGTEVAVPGPAETLTAVLVSGARVRRPPTLIWVVDAAMIVRSGGVDWSRLVEIGRSHGQTLRLRDALTYLSRLPETEIPTAAVHELAAAQVSPRERLVHRLASGTFGWAGALPELTARHVAATADASALAAALSFPAHLRAEWGMTRTRELPRAIARRVARRLRFLLA